MKQRTRKFLAGLLSLGMLLQAASPLSALAADDAAAAGTSTATQPTLELTFDPEYTAQKLTLTGQSDGTVTASSSLPNDIISTSYDPDTKTYTIKANFSKKVTLAGTAADSEAPSLKLELQSGSTIIPQNVNNVEIRSSSSISISNYTEILGDLDIKEVNGSIWMGGTVAGKLNIDGGDTCTDIYMQPSVSSTGYIFQSITVNAPAAERFRLIGTSYGNALTRDGITVTAKRVILEAPFSGKVGIVNFTAPDNRSYAAYTDYQKSTQIDVPAPGTDFTGSYLQIDAVSYPGLTVKTADDFCEIKTDGINVTLSSALPNTLTSSNVKYDATTSTYTIYGTHFEGSSKTIEIIGIADENGVKPSLIMRYENNPLVENGDLKVTGVQDFTAVATLGVANTLTVEAAGEVSLTSAPAPTASMDITAAGLTVETTLSENIGKVKFTPADTGNYKAYTDEAKTTSLEALPDGDVVNSKYLHIEKVSDDTAGGDDSGSTGGNTGANDSGNTGSDDSGSTGGNTGNDDSGNTGSDTSTEDSAGGAVAAVLMGGAAVWGGYEVVTRVILHDLLPEGAAIPASRGELAALVWNTAGRPEPAASPAFADIADPDTAKAAQWCVEQDLIDAKSEDTFKPDGWVPKFRTIEVWNRAFPKN